MCISCGIGSAIEVLEDFPTADVAEIKRGRWLPTTGAGRMCRTFVGWECSECGYMQGEYEYNYCPHCGAKMDEVEQNG